MRRFLRENGLSIVLLLSFAILLFGQSWAGWDEYNEERTEHGEPPLGYGAYLRSSHFWEATTENWESEFFQMGIYVMLTAFLFQRGSSESKKLDAPNPQDEDPRAHRQDKDAPGPVRRGGWVLRIYEYSLGLAFVLLFIGSFFAHAVSGRRLYNEEQVAAGKEPVELLEYLGSSRFWFESLQNWQSEFLAVASIVLLSIWLRYRGSPESKPVAAPHDETEE
jgi:Domain of unknown function (DUF6766)